MRRHINKAGKIQAREKGIYRKEKEIESVSFLEGKGGFSLDGRLLNSCVIRTGDPQDSCGNTQEMEKASV